MQRIWLGVFFALDVFQTAIDNEQRNNRGCTVKGKGQDAEYFGCKALE